MTIKLLGTGQIKPKFRKEAMLDLASGLRGALDRVLKEDQYQHPYQNCLLCDHFNEEKEVCKLYQKKPPARVIAYGCPSFEDEDAIPF